MRRAATLVCAALLATVATVPATAADGPALVNEHVAAEPQTVYDLSSSAAGTVYGAADGGVYLLRAPVTPESSPVRLVSGRRRPGYAFQEATIAGDRVAVPVVPTSSSPVTEVRWCLAASCPTLSTLTAPAGYRYLGNAGDVAVLYGHETNTLALQPWEGGDPQLVPLGDVTVPAALYAQGDSNGVVVGSGTASIYLARPSLAVTVLGGGPAYATPSYLVYAAPDGNGAFSVLRAGRDTPAAAPTIEATVLVRPRRLVATDAGFASWGSGWSATYVTTEAWGGDGAQTGPSVAVAPFEGGTSFLLQHGSGAANGLHTVAPGAASGTLTFVPPRTPERTAGLSVAHGRAAYLSQDQYSYSRAYTRAVDGGTPGAETKLDGHARAASLSGPYAVTATDAADKVHLRWTDPGGTPQWVELPGGANGRPFVSGHRAVVSGGTRATLVNLRTGRTVDLGAVVATLFGDLLFTADKNGRIVRRDMATGTTRVVYAGLPAGQCGTSCWATRGGWRLSAWGGELVYGLDLGTAGRVTGWFDGTATRAVPMLAGGWTAFTFWDRLLVTHRAGSGVHLYDLDTAAHAVVDETGAIPAGEQQSIDGTVVVWIASALDHRAGVRPITDFLPGYVPTARYQSATLPRGFGPGLAATAWRPAVHVSQDVPYQLVLRRGSATGPVVRTLAGTSVRGEITPVWDGLAATGSAAPHGWSHWSLTAGAVARSGRVFVSRVAPPAPALNAPVLASDTSATSRFTVSWSGAPAGHQYLVERSWEGASFFPDPLTTARGTTVTAQFSTYRFRVRVVDPAGRSGPAVKRTTVVPRDDREASTYGVPQWRRVHDSRYWKGSQLRTSHPYDSLSIGARGDGIWLIGSKGPSYARLRITLNGERTYVVDTYSPVPRFRQVLFKLGGLKLDWHHVHVDVLATGDRTTVGIDGLAGREPMHTSDRPG